MDHLFHDLGRPRRSVGEARVQETLTEVSLKAPPGGHVYMCTVVCMQCIQNRDVNVSRLSFRGGGNRDEDGPVQSPTEFTPDL